MAGHNFSETPKQENVELSVTLRVIWKQIIDYKSWRKKYSANGLENLWNLLSSIDSGPFILCQNKFTGNSLFYWKNILGCNVNTHILRSLIRCAV